MKIVAYDPNMLTLRGGPRMAPPQSERSFVLLGPQGEPIEVRYSDDQPRDPDGKFASGGAVSYTASEREAIKKQLADPSVVNTTLRAEKPLTAAQQSHVDALDAAINKNNPLEQPLTVYRATSIQSLNGEGFASGQPDNGITIGSTFTDKGYVSTTTDRATANDPGYTHPDDRLILTITVPAGSKVLEPSKNTGFQGAAAKLADWEHEVLLSRGSVFRIDNVVSAKELMVTLLLKEERSTARFNKADESRFSEDQPRDPDGKFASGGGSSENMPGKEAPEFLKPEMNDHEAKSAMVRNAARELNFPTDKVVTDQETKEFNVGDHHYTEGGHAEIYTTGNIVIHTNHVADDGVRGIVAHEVEHIRFQGVLKDYENEMMRLRELPSKEPLLWDSITTPNGYLDPDKGAGDHFPTAMALQEFFEKNSTELAKDDGVSAYSRSYWQTALDPKYSNGNYPAFRDRAIHETLAEMARMTFTKNLYATGDKPSKLWNGLFKTVNKLAKERGYGYNKRGR